MAPRWKLFAAGWGLVLAGGLLARLVQTAGGVEVRDVRFESPAGTRMSALLHVPPGATEASPAPGVLAVHGYINSRETQSGFAIELARRGYVVLALDQTGHGFSGGAAFSEGFGGPAGLEHLRGLPFVDPDRIALEGHSMGGWTVLAAATAHPDAYRSVTLVGSATGSGFSQPGTPTWPRNLGVVFSTYDEFARLMWGVRDAADVADSEKLQELFGVHATVVAGRVYGRLDEGTARWLATPVTTHPGDHISRAAIGDAVHWIEATVGGGAGLADEDQIWPWKELGTLVALVGGLVLLLGTFELLVSLWGFVPVTSEGVGLRDGRGVGWWGALAVSTVVPAVTYFPLTGWGAGFAASAVFPQGITNQILVWAIGNGLVSGAFLLRRRGPGEGAVAAKLLVALLSVAVVYVAVQLSHWLFLTDLRFWVVALKPMASRHVPAFLAYVVPFTAFFYLSHRALHATLSVRGDGAAAQYGTAIAATVGGFALMVMGLHAWLFATGHLPDAFGVGALFSVIAIQFVAVLTATAGVAVFTWRRTGGVLAGAVMCGVLVTWYIVAGQATHL